MPVSTAVDPSARARALGIKTEFKDLRPAGTLRLPQRIAVVGQGATASTYTTTKQQLTSARAVGEAYGYGSPLHLAAKQLLPSNGDGVGSIPVTFYPLEDAGGATTAAGTITPTGTATASGTLFVRVGGVTTGAIGVAVGDTVADLTAAITTAVNDTLSIPVVATDGSTVVDLDAKWAGASGNGMAVEVIGEVAGLTFALVNTTGGATNPDVTVALNQVGDVWETLVLNCLDIDDTTALDAYVTWNEGRWDAAVSKPAVVFTGSNEATFATAIAVPDARPTDRTNSQLIAPGSVDHPVTIAARIAARIAVVANNDPARDYGSLRVTNVIPGTDAQQWTYNQRDQAIKAGASSTVVRDGEVVISDTVTFHHPTGEEDPAYRHVVDIIKIQNFIFALDDIFNRSEWDGAPLVPDDQPVASASAKKPRMARAQIAAVIDAFAADAIISDPDFAKSTIVAEINSSNTKRLDVAVTVKLSGNTNIISVDFNFGFYLGTQPVIA